MEPMAVMEYCIPMGTPMMHRVRQEDQFSRRSSRLMRSTGNFLAIKTRQAAPEMPWETTVAMAAPATPASNHRMKAKSSAMFSTEERARKYTGVRLSPRERRIPASRL